MNETANKVDTWVGYGVLVDLTFTRYNIANMKGKLLRDDNDNLKGVIINVESDGYVVTLCEEGFDPREAIADVYSNCCVKEVRENNV